MRRTLNDISRHPFDLVVVGAGINGAGVARDAASRGLRVLLLDKGDIGGGTTSWSTRLIHGGLRYLEHGEWSLVRESLRERETLLRRIAPHLVAPLAMLIPIYSGSRRGSLTVRAGMAAYDLLSRDKTLPRHRMLGPEAAREYAPGLDASRLKGAALFFDAQVEYAERLAVENALAARSRGAVVVTHARVERLLTEGGEARGVEFEDVLGGGSHVARAPLVLNAAGPWVDEVLEGVAAGRAGEKLIGGTKGSHVVVRPFEGAPRVAVYAEAGADGRPFFIIPWDDKFLIGTTDVRYEGDLDRVVADEGEIAYLLRETNRVMPPARLAREHVLYTYSGVRPLPSVGAGPEAGITRRHFVRASRVRGLFSVVGGKLTTYRSLAEEVVGLLFKQLGRAAPPCVTAREPLPGAEVADYAAFKDEFKRTSPLAPKSTERLLKVYGARAADVLRLVLEDAELARPVSEETGTVGAEVVFAFREEMAETLTDCLMRRTMVGLNGRLGLDAAEPAARLAQKHLGWTDGRAASEVEAYGRYVERFVP
ncbi:MAG TPA: glycerol-3-phosphate dehydrogenase [Pyrinomonadaceae bacterium]|jgi:glycerol-3-phosphate dehydrogenase|nr:glycerol-3-phosphate dehydrogenase [Pyrinomonadaceae bacterium]